VYVFFRVFSSTLKEKFKQTNLSRKKAEGSVHTDGQIDDLINNAPRILNEINKTIAEQKAQGVSDEQMKGIFQKKQMLELVTNNAEVINIIGKPIIKKLLGFVKSI
jgi:tetrahydromethanopterin S-methyltransferase subunit H